MSHCLQWLLVGGFAVGASGCASLGKPLNSDETRQALTVGTSTKEDVGKVLGKATVNTFRSGYEVWVYSYKAGLPAFVGLIPGVGMLSTAVDAVTHDRELAILFDDKGIVRKYRLRESESQVERIMADR
jgi:hypothetical protein